MSKRILTDIRKQVPMVTPFELRKRVLVQAAWSSGCSVFAYKPATRPDETIRSDLADLYRELADFVIQRTREEDHA
jgi:hypothetical protein